MRTYGRVQDPAGNSTWVVVQTDDTGHDDYVWATTVIQSLRLNLGESPFYGNYGIPAQQSVVTQVFPDYYVYQTQSQFSRYFASLLISKLDSRTPTYDVSLTTNAGAKVQTLALTRDLFVLGQSALDSSDVLG